MRFLEVYAPNASSISEYGTGWVGSNNVRAMRTAAFVIEHEPQRHNLEIPPEKLQK
jgi:hypothetical protein